MEGEEMRVLDHPPATAGEARIRYDLPRYQPPHVYDNTIHLPRKVEGAEFFELIGGQNVAIVLPGTDREIPQFLLCGTDSTGGNFCSRHTSVRYADPLREGNERAYYQSLVPSVVKTLLSRYGGDYQRQGDMFFWEGDVVTVLVRELKLTSETLWGRFHERPIRSHSGLALYRRRHTLEAGGYVISRPTRNPSFPTILKRNVIVARGTVTAPDHTPVRLPDYAITMASEAFTNAAD